jgi:hypothetical protein
MTTDVQSDWLVNLKWLFAWMSALFGSLVLIGAFVGPAALRVGIIAGVVGVGALMARGRPFPPVRAGSPRRFPERTAYLHASLKRAAAEAGQRLRIGMASSVMALIAVMAAGTAVPHPAFHAWEEPISARRPAVSPPVEWALLTALGAFAGVLAATPTFWLLVLVLDARRPRAGATC